jgi:hypothetical protein
MTSTSNNNYLASAYHTYILQHIVKTPTCIFTALWFTGSLAMNPSSILIYTGHNQYCGVRIMYIACRDISMRQPNAESTSSHAFTHQHVNHVYFRNFVAALERLHHAFSVELECLQHTHISLAIYIPYNSRHDYHSLPTYEYVDLTRCECPMYSIWVMYGIHDM